MSSRVVWRGGSANIGRARESRQVVIWQGPQQVAVPVEQIEALIAALRMEGREKPPVREPVKGMGA